MRSVTRRFASRSVSRSGAAISATGSAWWRISPPTGTRIGWSAAMLATTLVPGMSSAVTTTTRSHGNAGSSSIASSVAWASVERIVAPYQAPGNTMSSVYRAVPVSLAGPSRRVGTATPRVAAGGAACVVRAGVSIVNLGRLRRSSAKVVIG